MQKFFKSIPILLVSLLTMTLTSCKFDDDYQEQSDVSAIAFNNGIVGSPDLNIYVGNNRVVTNPFTFGKSVFYVNAFSGNREISLYEGNEKKLTSTYNLEIGKIYSLFLAGKWPDGEMILFKDELRVPEAGRVNIRFLNLSKDAGALDLGLTNGTTLFTNQTYKNEGTFISMDPTKSYTFVIRNHANKADTVMIPAVTLEPNRNYTVWAKGLKSETGDNALSIGLIRNY